MKKLKFRRSFRVPLIFGIFSVLWIMFSDRLAFATAPNLESAGMYSTIKGLVYVILATLLIFFLLRRDESKKDLLMNEIAAVQRSFNLLFEDNPQAMWIYDNATLEIMAVNPAACKVYGYASDEFRKLKITDLRRKEDIPSMIKVLTEYKDELRQSGPWEHLKKDGESIFVKVISHPLRSVGLDSTLVSIIDLTEHQKTLSELDTAMQERDDFESFGYTASHDLKAPIRAILGYSDLLMKEYNKKLDDEGNGFVQQIHKAGLTMNEMLDDMLVLTGISRKPLEYERVNLSEIVLETMNTLRLQEPDRKLELKVKPEMMVIADRGVIRLIAQNLLQNAWKYTKKTADALVEVGNFQNNEGEMVFFVKDNGLGFDQSYAEHIFEPFKRAHKNSTYEGMGIGLSIVRRAVEHHDGRVWVEAEPGKGACFYFTLQQKEQFTNELS
jgi:PAS domain S-box-containing protein